SNPLDAMVFVAKQVTGFPRERVIGSAGVLDSARFRTNLALAAGVSVEDVQAIVLGAHTDKDMVPITSTAMIGNVPVAKFLSPEKEAFGKSVAANTELMNIARGFLG